MTEVASPVVVPRIVPRIGLVAGPLLAVLAFVLLPDAYRDDAGELVALPFPARATIAVAAWMAAWWLTEAIDLAATALLPIVLFPLLGVAKPSVATAAYASPLIFLFMGGFMIALAMQRWGLDRRIALATLRLVGARPPMIVAGFMLATAALSGVVSNTATAAMMMPVAASVLALAAGGSARVAAGPARDDFSVALLLGIAYAASIGGLATLVGSPPNLLLASFFRDQVDPSARLDIGFARWMVIGVPLAVVLLPLVWLLLCGVLHPVLRMPEIAGGRAAMRAAYDALGAPSRAERLVFVVFVATAVLWIARPWLQELTLPIGDDGARPLAGLDDAGIAIIAGVLLFVLPSGRGGGLLDWPTALGMPWGILLLFGGGLSLAGAVERTGVAEFIAAQAGGLHALPAVLLIGIVAVAVIFMTELTSNTATAATLIPVLAALAPALDVHPLALALPAALAASCAFMLPVATPPNAIVFGTGRLTIRQMARAGLLLNLLGAAVVTAWTLVVLRLWTAH